MNKALGAMIKTVSVEAVFFLHPINATERPERNPQEHHCQHYPTRHDEKTSAIRVKFGGYAVDLGNQREYSNGTSSPTSYC